MASVTPDLWLPSQPQSLDSYFTVILFMPTMCDVCQPFVKRIYMMMTYDHRPLAGTKLYCLVTEAHGC